ncbi:uncharacterized protein LOC6579863 [Drosophila mojavensis]|uniref:Protein TsetseEP domain-containing protein n=1 Tax=Drosophila mojavensis TaxID=7230 RepID=B4KU75_DROMO|nr:uncharacterized protein LOC6579863 [Drosophila mojavensis]EDW09671.1 uncharacterized protein Dmoj_GI20628 [Drosophila mojavensis]
MQNSVLFLVLLVCLAPFGAISAENLTIYLEDYIIQNQRQNDARLAQIENELDTVRSTFSSGLRAISIQADQMELKLEEVKARLDPIELIDSWHKQCVQNYSGTIPSITSVRTTLNSCSSSAQGNLNSILSNSQNTFNSLKNYYNNNAKKLLTDCAKAHIESLTNYTACVKNAISTVNTYTISNQKSFNTYMQQAKCAADIRINQAWECAFTSIYSTVSAVSTAVRLIDDCIFNQLACASVTCSTGCSNHMVISLKENDFHNETIKNPFIGLNSKLGCIEMKFKN